MAKDGEDKHGLQTTNFKHLGWTIQEAQNRDEATYIPRSEV